tara:strand:- start:324 stop:920 length:597 start_codon:yes stop_codon:yes gene_type:complete
MAKKKVTIERTPIKPVKKKRKLSEETKEKLRARLADMRAKKKPAEYKNVSKKVLALPDDDRYSFKNVKEWIKETKDQISALNSQSRGRNVLPQDRQKASNLADSKKAYIRYCEHYIKTGDWIGMFSGKHEEQKVVPRCVAMAYYPDGTPKRSVGVFYPDINAVWTSGMDESEYATQGNREYVKSETVALTDKQFTGEV